MEQKKKRGAPRKTAPSTARKTATVNTTEGPKELPMEPVERAVETKKEPEYVSAPKDMIVTRPGYCIVTIAPQTERPGERAAYRISGKEYTVATGKAVEVPNHLAIHIVATEQAKRRSAQILARYEGNGVNLGELK